MKRSIAISVVSVLVCACCLSGCAASQGSSGGEAPSGSKAGDQARISMDLSLQSEGASSQGDAQTSASQSSGEEGSMVASRSGTAQVSIDGSTFVIELADSVTASAFAGLFPMQMQMSEMNGNEKYAYLDEPLPSDPVNPGTIEAGDVMLYGDNCIVIFYESHPTTYTYTPIGRIADVAGLQAAVGADAITASFSLT